MRHAIELPPEPRSAAAARHFVACELDGVCPDLADLAVLLTSELVTNVVVHARTPLEVVVDCEPRRVHVEVADAAPRSPVLRHAHDARLTGRGMTLVDSLATRWGVEPHPPGKRVWFEVSA